MSRGVYMKRKIIALLLCIVCVVSLCFPVAADDDGYSAIVSDITCDNGCEFAAAKEMEQFAPIYYCHPYSSWERGTNENQNKLIRRFCKKGKSMACVTADHAEYITLWMNNYPRRLLGWRRPADLMAAECAAMGIKLAV